MLDGLSPEEKELTKGMPDEVAIGFIKARRKANGQAPYMAGLGDFFEQIFKRP